MESLVVMVLISFVFDYCLEYIQKQSEGRDLQKSFCNASNKLYIVKGCLRTKRQTIKTVQNDSQIWKGIHGLSVLSFCDNLLKRNL